MQARTICFVCIRRMWQVFAVTLVVLAVLVSVIKYSLPYVNNHKDHIEALINNHFNVDISIGEISASWEGAGPALVLKSLTFSDSSDAPIALSVKKTSVQVNVLESIKNRQFRSDYFILEGFVADIDLPSLSTQNNDSGFEQKTLIENFFLGKTGHFAIKESQLNITLKNSKTHTLLLNDLEWQNDVHTHKGMGEVAILGLTQGHFSAQLDLKGETLESLGGQIYLKGENVNISPWIAKFLATDKGKVHTQLNARMWLNIRSGRWQDAFVDWQKSTFFWQESGQNKQLSVQPSAISFKPNAGLAHFWSEGIRFTSDKQAFSELFLQGEISAHQQSLWFTGFDTQLISSLASLIPLEAAKHVTDVSPKGAIDGYITQQHSKPMSLWLGSESMDWQAVNSIPGASDVRLDLTMTGDKGVFVLHGENGQFDTSDAFTKPLQYEQVHGEIQFYKETEGWHLESDSIWLNNQDLTLAAELHLRLLEQPQLDLYAEVYGGKADIAHHYFPQKVMSKKLISYLNDAILAGAHQHSQVLLSGVLSQFPFADKTGQFEVLSKINNVDFSFAPNWPAVKGATTTLHFENERMDIVAVNGQIANQTIEKDVVVSIDNLKAAKHLTVDIIHSTNAETLPAFFSKTPIAKPLVNILEIVQSSGEISANVHLEVDLKKFTVLSSGDVYFKDMPIYLTSPGMTLDNVNGVLSFTDNNIELTSANASWLGMPMSFSISGQNSEQGFALDINAQLIAQSDKLLPYSGGLLDGYLSGETPLNTDINLSFMPQGMQFTANFESDLVGLTSYLPAPFNKLPKHSKLLSGTVSGADVSNLISFNIDKQLFFNGILDNQTRQFSHSHIIVGEQDLGLSQSGLHVSINQKHTELIAWVPFIEKLLQSTETSKGSQSIFPSLNTVSANIGTLQIENILLDDLSMLLKPSSDGLTMNLNAKQLRAEVIFPASKSSRPILITSDYLRLNLEKHDNKGSPAYSEPEQLNWLVNIPAIDLRCADCKVNTYQLDKVSMSLFGDSKQLNISELVIDKRDHILRAQGSYKAGISQFSGELDSKDIGELFDEYDLTSSIKDSKATMNYNLNWRGAPFEFNVQSLDGEAQWELGEGHLAEISDKGARVLSLLSLDSLVRKLKLDFRDVFSKGFFYNKLTGSIQLERGVAYTKDTKMDGVPADLTIQGYANLNNQEINYDVAISPQVTSSLPVIIGWMVNPVTGLATLALDKVIHSAKVISELKYKVTGTISKPILTQIDRKSREITLPQAAQNQPSQGINKQESILPNQELPVNTIKDSSLAPATPLKPKPVIKEKVTKEGSDLGA